MRRTANPEDLGPESLHPRWMNDYCCKLAGQARSEGLASTTWSAKSRAAATISCHDLTRWKESTVKPGYFPCRNGASASAPRYRMPGPIDGARPGPRPYRGSRYTRRTPRPEQSTVCPPGRGTLVRRVYGELHMHEWHVLLPEQSLSFSHCSPATVLR